MQLSNERAMFESTAHSTTRTGLIVTTVLVLLISPFLVMGKSPCFDLPGERQPSWCKPGCHKVGFRQPVAIPGCIKFWSETNACRGFCMSESYPSLADILHIAPKQTITTAGRCCVMKPKTIKYNVYCRGGNRTVMVKSAISCYCGSCQKY